MRHFPIFLFVAGWRIVVAGGGEAAVAKLRLLLKSEARIEVHAKTPAAVSVAWTEAGRLTLVRRALAAGDATGAALFYAASGDEAERIVGLARAESVIVNAVDNLKASDFITPAIVDRDPVTVAVGTEGAAPVLARAIQTEVEERLPQSTGQLARAGQTFRPAAEALPHGLPRRAFWAEWYATAGPDALARGADPAAALESLLARHLARKAEPGRVVFVGAGPGDPELLTLKARRALDRADVVIHDRLVAAPILELVRREAIVVAAGKEGFGPSARQADINALIVRHATRGALVVRLKSGDPTVFGRLDEEIKAVEAAGVEWSVTPGITATSAALASLGQSPTRRGRNSGARLVTGHDVDGLAEHDWRALARPGEVAAIDMGKRAARFVQGRLVMHGADPLTPVSVVENASRPGERILDTILARLPDDLAEARFSGPTVNLLGLASRRAAALTHRKIAS